MKTIVWDVDDVLNDMMRTWFERWWVPSHPDCRLGYDQISENPPHQLLGISKSDYLASLDAFRLSDLAKTMLPVHEVLEWFRRYGEHHRHAVLTAAPLSAAEVSAAWVMRHFGCWIRSFNLIPSPRESERTLVYDRSKTEYLKWWGKADIVVDDATQNVQEALSLGIRAVLIPRPWNRSGLSLAEALERIAAGGR
jgi:hypothetical protein